MCYSKRSVDVKSKGPVVVFSKIRNYSRSGLSFGVSMNFREDANLMNFSLAFLIYLLTIEAQYHVEDTVTLCKRFRFAEFGPMMAQKAIPTWVVVLVRSSSLSAKKYVQMSWKQQQTLVGDETPLETTDKMQRKQILLIKVWDLRHMKEALKVFDGVPNNYPQTNVAFSPDEQINLTGTSVEKDSSIGLLCFYDRTKLKCNMRK